MGTTADRIEEVVERLRRTALVDRGDQGDEGGHLFVQVGPDDPDMRYAHIHVVDRSSQQWHRYLAFRDRLRSDASLRRAYEALKSQLAVEHPLDRDLYAAGKSDFIRAVVGET